MLETILLTIETHVLPLGAAGVFLASLVEEIIAPIPSAVVQLASGFLFVEGPISFASLWKLFWIVVLPASAGVTVGSIVIYSIAFAFGKPALLRWGKWFGLYWQDVEKVQEKFQKSSFDELTLFISRCVPIIPSVVISAFCGLLRVKPKTYVLYTFLGTVVRSAILGFIGWQVGNVYVRYAEVIDSFEDAILIVTIIAVLAFIARAFIKKNKNNDRDIISP